MRFRHTILQIAFILGGASGSALMAQSLPSYDWSEVHDVKLSHGWLHSENVSGLTTLAPALRRSAVQLYFEKEEGDLHNHYESSDPLEFGAEATSYYRFSERVAAWGEMRYRNQRGKQMSGSYFIDPTHTPFDLVELTAENAGEKRYEEYHVAGGIGAQLLRSVAGGVKIDYTAANYAKRKDLRHTNSLMDLSLTAGVKFSLGRKVDLGADYTYRRRNETLLLSTYGKTDKTYFSLLDYGAFFGKQETFGEVGYTKQNETKPLFEQYHGGAVQLVWRITNGVEWFNEAHYRLRDGSYGEDSPSTVVYATHDGLEWGYKTVLTIRSKRHQHTLTADFATRSVDNHENLYAYRNEETGRDWVDYLGSRDVGKKEHETVQVRYTGRFDVKEGLPKWSLAVGGSYDHRLTRATNYPDYRKQDIAWWRTTITAKRNFQHTLNRYSIGLEAGLGGGLGDPSKDGRHATSSESQTLSRTLDDRLMQEFEYLTAMQWRAGLHLGYMRIIGKAGIRCFVEGEYHYGQACDVAYLGNGLRHRATMRIGCHF